MFKFESLEIWKLSVGYAIKVLGFVETLPENAGEFLGDRIVDAALDIPVLIAEGSESSKDVFAEKLKDALSCIYELSSLMYVLKEKAAISDKDFLTYYNELIVLEKKIASVKSSM